MVALAEVGERGAHLGVVDPGGEVGGGSGVLDEGDEAAEDSGGEPGS